jgi:hypothetical protein
MPIRFRCKYCNQLMGIAHRKAGMEVECPTCKGQLLVPQTSQEPAAPPSPPPPQISAPLFERNDFADFLNPQPAEPILAGASQPAASRPQPAQATRPVIVPSYKPDVEPMPGALAPLEPQPVGIVLTPTRATMLTVAVIIGLAVAFSLGLIIGKSL